MEQCGIMRQDVFEVMLSFLRTLSITFVTEQVKQTASLTFSNVKVLQSDSPFKGFETLHCSQSV